MARGRIIDREFFSHEILGEMSLMCRYLYQGLIVFADDEGHAETKVAIPAFFTFIPWPRPT